MKLLWREWPRLREKIGKKKKKLLLLDFDGTLVGIDPAFEILDDEEATELQNTTGGSRYRNHGRPWSRHRIRRSKPPEQVAEFGALYEHAKREEGVVDFDDLVVYAANLFEDADREEAHGFQIERVVLELEP